MHLKDLTLKNFRNYRELQLEFSPQVNYFYGDNGSGKTNILEAIQLVVLGESFRTHQLNTIIPKGEILNPNIRTTLVSPQTEHQLQFSLSLGKRVLTRNEKRESQRQRYLDFSTVVFSPESLEAIKSEPAVRRKLLDNLTMGLFPETTGAFIEFSRALKSRNFLLKQVMEFGPSKERLAHLESLDFVYLRIAADVIVARLKAIKTMREKFTEISEKILRYRDVEIAVDYVISQHSAIDWSHEQVYDALLSRLRDLAMAERASGRTLIGPQKHDVRFIFAGQDARSYCSQGQQRALILAFKIAQIESHQEIHRSYPLLLLDDVLSELDQERRESLVELLQNTPTQIFMTTTEREQSSNLGDRPIALFEVNQGHVTRKG